MQAFGNAELPMSATTKMCTFFLAIYSKSPRAILTRGQGITTNDSEALYLEHGISGF